MAAVVSGMFTIFIEKADASAEDAIGSMLPEEVQVDTEDESTIELAPGAVIDLNEGRESTRHEPRKTKRQFWRLCRSNMPADRRSTFEFRMHYL